MKRIGIVGWSTGDKSFGISKPYLNYFQRFGLVQILTPSDFIDESIDLLVLPGGADIDPKRYNQVQHEKTQKPNLSLEYFDTLTLQKYISSHVPIFGICRGLQSINVHFGGTLTQHIETHPTSIERHDIVHRLYEPSEMINENKIFLMETNSIHHQCINTLGNDLSVELYSEDGIIEAIKHTTLPIYGVQWHPEHIDDTYSNKIINKLLNNAN